MACFAMKNQVQLITYVDRLSGGGIADLHQLLCATDSPLRGLFGGVHLLPFFYPIDGSDAGFDPIDHTRVDPRLGDWADLKRIGADLDVMGDVIVNHVSSSSPQFQDWLKLGAASDYDGMFLTVDKVFSGGATEAQLKQIYRPRPGLPFTEYEVGASGKHERVWTTFTPQQIDIDVAHAQGAAYLRSILERFASSGVRTIRLDAVGYAIKKPGTSSFMLPETFDFIAQFATVARSLGMEVLVEVHAYYQRQIEIASKVDWVYDFALPPLVLHALSFGKADALKRWIDIRPVNSLTVLDTHDGIGIIDIGADVSNRADNPGLVPPQELDALVERIHTNSGGQSRLATGAVASNLDLYQVNCTFYDALARDDNAYLAARAIQFFLPGVPQVYYTGLLAGENDMDLLAKTRVGRDINRHHYSSSEVKAATQKPVVQQLMALIRLRNAHPAFTGQFESLACDAHELQLRWRQAEQYLELAVDLRKRSFDISGTGLEAFAARAWVRS
jgi:sucrose phosphorylase